MIRAHRIIALQTKLMEMREENQQISAIRTYLFARCGNIWWIKHQHVDFVVKPLVYGGHQAREDHIYLHLIYRNRIG